MSEKTPNYHSFVTNADGTTRLCVQNRVNAVTGLQEKVLPKEPKAPAQPVKNQDPFHPSGCPCERCVDLRIQARLKNQEWISQVRREARRKDFESRCNWIRPILTGFQGESALDE